MTLKILNTFKILQIQMGGQMETLELTVVKILEQIIKQQL
jgi:hypothetical protein